MEAQLVEQREVVPSRLEGLRDVIAGEKIGRYTLLGKLAAGGMAEVFLAKQEGPEGFAKTVVIKRILPQLASDTHFIQMFLNEARLAALLNHPNVVSIYELGQDEASGSYFMAMEWIEGCNLKRLIQAASKRGALPPAVVTAHIIADACAGLDFAHNLKSSDGKALDIVHRDISPQNILITYGGVVKVVDFGIAKATQSESLTQHGQLKGKFSYMAPELLMGGSIDKRADVWALGVTLYWMMCGSKPFSGDSEGQLVQRILYEEPPPPNKRVLVPENCMAIINKALKKNLDERYDSARAMQRDLEEVVASSGALASVVTDYVGDLFPEESDPDRALTRAILSGDLRQQNTPSSMRSSSSSANVSHLLRPPRRAPNWLLIGVSVLALIFAAATVVALVMLRQGTLSAEVADLAAPAQPSLVLPPAQPSVQALPGLPAPAPAPMVAPAVAPPGVEPEPEPVAPLVRRPAPKRHHDRPAADSAHGSAHASGPPRDARTSGRPLGRGLSRWPAARHHAHGAGLGAVGDPQGEAGQQRDPRHQDPDGRGQAR